MSRRDLYLVRRAESGLDEGSGDLFIRDRRDRRRGEQAHPLSGTKCPFVRRMSAVIRSAEEFTYFMMRNEVIFLSPSIRRTSAAVASAHSARVSRRLAKSLPTTPPEAVRSMLASACRNSRITHRASSYERPAN
jgi:hypothetical protein